MSTSDLEQRWDTFLGKIRGSCESLLTGAIDDSRQLLTETDLDPTPLSNAWSGVHAEVFAFQEKIDATWREKVEPGLEAAGLEPEAVHAHAAKGRTLRAELDLQFLEREHQVFAEAADRLLERAREELRRTFRCTQCGAALEPPEHFFRSCHVPCVYCQAVNTFEPGSRVRMVEHFCAHHLSERAARDAWRALRKAEEARRLLRSDTVPVLETLHAATLRYWTEYLRARATLVPVLAIDFPRDLTGKMRALEAELATHPLWRKR